MVTYDEFSKIDLKIARVISAERVENSEKLIKLKVDCGDIDEKGEKTDRQIVAGIGKNYEPESLVDREIVIVANLEPKLLMGMESRGMLLAASDEKGPVLLIPEKDTLPGTKIK